ncbi:MAG: hypothetical protein RBS39_03635 [Phycisphaerales bacterium]|jgi:hypothetical protein|nr:hypothetical protein [Phycisphaerales bacterium]
MFLYASYATIPISVVLICLALNGDGIPTWKRTVFLVMLVVIGSLLGAAFFELYKMELSANAHSSNLLEWITHDEPSAQNGVLAVEVEDLQVWIDRTPRPLFDDMARNAGIFATAHVALLVPIGAIAIIDRRSAESARAKLARRE